MKLVKSIRGRLLLWIFFSITVLFLISGYTLHRELRKIILQSIDNTLHASLQFVKGMVHTHDGANVEYELDEFLHGEYVIPRSGHYYKVFVDGSMKTASYSLPDWNFDLIQGKYDTYNKEAQEWTYISVGPAGEHLRVIRHDFEFMKHAISLQVAQTLTESDKVIKQLTSHCLIIMPLMTALIGLVSLTIATVSLRPLKIFSAAIEKITHKTLDGRIAQGDQAKELQGLARRFNALLARLQQAFEAEKHLIADAAHELKTPIAVIRAECDIALQKTRKPEEYAESLQEIRQVSATMLDQVNGLMTLARLDSGMLDASAFKVLSLNACIEDALRLVEPLAKKGGIVLSNSLTEKLTVQGDKDSLTEAILNLIENAVKYNRPAAGSVDVELTSEAGQARLVVSDTGMGIGGEEIERIFDRFYRSKKARNKEGTGLGLSIVRAVIQAHNGEIKAESELGKGSRFIVTLPLAEAAA